jgi:phosphohistidine phosphatase SixA
MLAWAALLTHAVSVRGTAWAVVLLVLAFLTHYVRDRRLAPVVSLPPWYLPLRLQLTTVACLSLLSLGFPLPMAVVAHAATPPPSAASAAASIQSGDIVLVRHASAPGTGDPAAFRLNDCTTQRNLDEAGRAQARRIGQQVRALGVPVGAVWTSQWCRTRETARLAFSLPAQDMPAFNSFFEHPAGGKARTEAALRALAQWSGPGLLVVVTHQVNITGLTGIYPASGEIVIVRKGTDGGISAIGSIKTD